MKPIIVYQMGKVGSSSLSATLDKYSIPSLHIHRYFFGSYETPPKNQVKAVIQKLRKRITFDYYSISNKPTRVVSLYRNPLPRNISSFFQNLPAYFKPAELKKLNFDQLRETFDATQFIQRTPQEWFDVELKQKTGMDILVHDFDQEVGFGRITNDNWDLFLCAVESLDNLELELAEFLGLEKFQLVEANRSENKWYHDLYIEFLAQYKPDAQLLDQLYSSPTARHFYSPIQLQEFRSRWV